MQNQIGTFDNRVPNFEQNDVNVQIENGTLVISAERHEKEEDKNNKYVVCESSSSFYRLITLPERADADKTEVHLDDGVLKVSVPLTPLPEPKKIAVSVRRYNCDCTRHIKKAQRSLD
jgi:HSP20 family protein